MLYFERFSLFLDTQQRFYHRFNGLFRYTHLIELSEAPLMNTKTNKNKLRYSKRLSVIGNLSYLLVLSSYFITEKLSLFFHAEANTKKAGCKPVPNGYLQPAFAINQKSVNSQLWTGRTKLPYSTGPLPTLTSKRFDSVSTQKENTYEWQGLMPSLSASSDDKYKPFNALYFS